MTHLAENSKVDTFFIGAEQSIKGFSRFAWKKRVFFWCDELAPHTLHKKAHSIWLEYFIWPFTNTSLIFRSFTLRRYIEVILSFIHNLTYNLSIYPVDFNILLSRSSSGGALGKSVLCNFMHLFSVCFEKIIYFLNNSLRFARFQRKLLLIVFFSLYQVTLPWLFALEEKIFLLYAPHMFISCPTAILVVRHITQQHLLSTFATEEYTRRNTSISVRGSEIVYNSMHKVLLVAPNRKEGKFAPFIKVVLIKPNTLLPTHGRRSVATYTYITKLPVFSGSAAAAANKATPPRDSAFQKNEMYEHIVKEGKVPLVAATSSHYADGTGRTERLPRVIENPAFSEDAPQLVYEGLSSVSEDMTNTFGAVAVGNIARHSKIFAGADKFQTECSEKSSYLCFCAKSGEPLQNPSTLEHKAFAAKAASNSKSNVDGEDSTSNSESSNSQIQTTNDMHGSVSTAAAARTKHAAAGRKSCEGLRRAAAHAKKNTTEYADDEAIVSCAGYKEVPKMTVENNDLFKTKNVFQGGMMQNRLEMIDKNTATISAGTTSTKDANRGAVFDDRDVIETYADQKAAEEEAPSAFDVNADAAKEKSRRLIMEEHVHKKQKRQAANVAVAVEGASRGKVALRSRTAICETHAGLPMQHVNTTSISSGAAPVVPSLNVGYPLSFLNIKSTNFKGAAILEETTVAAIVATLAGSYAASILAALPRMILVEAAAPTRESADAEEATHSVKRQITAAETAPSSSKAVESSQAESAAIVNVTAPAAADLDAEIGSGTAASPKNKSAHAEMENTKAPGEGEADLVATHEKTTHTQATISRTGELARRSPEEKEAEGSVENNAERGDIYDEFRAWQQARQQLDSRITSQLGRGDFGTLVGADSSTLQKIKPAKKTLQALRGISRRWRVPGSWSSHLKVTEGPAGVGIARAYLSSARQLDRKSLLSVAQQEALETVARARLWLRKRLEEARARQVSERPISVLEKQALRSIFLMHQFNKHHMLNLQAERNGILGRVAALRTDDGSSGQFVVNECVAVRYSDYEPGIAGYDPAVDSCRCPAGWTACAKSDAAASPQSWEPVVRETPGTRCTDIGGEVLLRNMQAYSCSTRDYVAHRPGVVVPPNIKDKQCKHAEFLLCKAEESQCYTGPWSLWTQCSTPCGDGYQYRWRKQITVGAHKAVGVDFCAPYHMEERRKCNLGPCPHSVVQTICHWTTVQIDRIDHPYDEKRHGCKCGSGDEQFDELNGAGFMIPCTAEEAVSSIDFWINDLKGYCTKILDGDETREEGIQHSPYGYLIRVGLAERWFIDCTGGWGRFNVFDDRLFCGKGMKILCRLAADSAVVPFGVATTKTKLVIEGKPQQQSMLSMRQQLSGIPIVTNTQLPEEWGSIWFSLTCGCAAASLLLVCLWKRAALLRLIKKEAAAAAGKKPRSILFLLLHRFLTTACASFLRRSVRRLYFHLVRSSNISAQKLEIYLELRGMHQCARVMAALRTKLAALAAAEKRRNSLDHFSQDFSPTLASESSDRNSANSNSSSSADYGAGICLSANYAQAGGNEKQCMREFCMRKAFHRSANLHERRVRVRPEKRYQGRICTTKAGSSLHTQETTKEQRRRSHVLLTKKIARPFEKGENSYTRESWRLDADSAFAHDRRHGHPAKRSEATRAARLQERIAAYGRKEGLSPIETLLFYPWLIFGERKPAVYQSRRRRDTLPLDFSLLANNLYNTSSTAHTGT